MWIIYDKINKITSTFKVAEQLKGGNSELKMAGNIN